MVIVLIHWLIKPGFEEKFLNCWNSMGLDNDTGFHKETLTTPYAQTSDPKYHTFNLESPNYKTYINIGIWSSLEDFDKAIQKYFPPLLPNTNGKQVIELEDFEFKLRERVVLKVVSERYPSNN